jgi:hypothetical protein
LGFTEGFVTEMLGGEKVKGSKFLFIFMIGFFLQLLFPTFLVAQEEDEQIEKLVTRILKDAEEVLIIGKIEDIIQDSGYLIIEGQKILIDEEFLERFPVRKGDDVQLLARGTEKGLKAVECNFIEEEIGKETE